MPQTITIKEFAEILGVSRMTIYRMRESGELPDVIKTKRRIVRWLKNDIEFWLTLDCPSQVNFRKLRKTKQRFQ